MVRLRKQPRSWTIKECYAEDNAPKVSDLDWIPKTSALFLEELLMEKKKAAEMHSLNAVAFLHTVSSPFIWKAHELETHFWKSVLFPHGQPLKIYIWHRGYTAIHSMHMADCDEGQQLLLCNLTIIIINHPRCSKLPNGTFRTVISALCRRTWMVWMWWLMSIWSHFSQRNAE